jgi:hypothetical protein
MKKDTNKTVMVIALISVLLCGCPGCALLFPGFSSITGALGQIDSFEALVDDLVNGFINGGWMVCLGGLLVLVPFVLVIIAVVKRTGKEELEDLEPTGVSKDDPIPPPS